MIIKDKKYMTSSQFINGKLFSKNIRKVPDVQKFFNFILEQRSNEMNKQVVDFFFENVFSNLN